MKLRENCKIRDVAGEKIVVIQGAEGADLTRVIMLNATAEFLWNELKGKEFQEADVARLIEDNFEVDSSRAADDARKWLESLSKAGLLE